LIEAGLETTRSIGFSGKAFPLWPVADGVFVVWRGASAQQRITFGSSLLEHTLLEKVPVTCDFPLGDTMRRGMAQLGLQAGRKDQLS
jgi:hypothetical protein